MDRGVRRVLVPQVWIWGEMGKDNSGEVGIGAMYTKMNMFLCTVAVTP